MHLSFEQHVAASRTRLFEFHANPANLAELLEGWRGFTLLEHDGHIRPGSRVSLEQRVLGLRHEMVFEHFVLDPGRRFGERQVQGPFRRFEHVHELSDDGNGARIVDNVDFALPWFLGGAFADRLVAAPVLRRFFAFRRAAYRRLCETGRLG